MTIVHLMSGPDAYQQNLDAGLGGQVSALCIAATQHVQSLAANSFKILA